MRLSSTHRSAVCACTLVLLSACERDSNRSPLSPSNLQTLNVADLVSSVSAAGIDGASRGGQAPAPSGGPAVTVSGNQRVINGGTLTVNVAAAAPFQTLYLFVGVQTLGLTSEAAGGVDGFYEVRLPSPQLAATALLGISQTIPIRDLDLQFAVADPSGAVGPFTSLTTTVTTVGTGDIQVTLSWDADSDVDLHVVEPGGEEVYYANERSVSGGQLDLDSNAGCSIDGVRNENITWPVGQARRGVYTVRVDYWSNCNVERTNYTVRINNGGNVQIFTGSFTGPGDAGGAGSGRLIATFERLTGPATQTRGDAAVRNSASGASIKRMKAQTR